MFASMARASAGATGCLKIAAAARSCRIKTTACLGTIRRSNARKVSHDFILRFAIRFERVVFRQLPLRFRLRWMASSSAEASSYAQGFGVTRRRGKQDGATSWGKEIRGQNVKGFAHVPGRTESEKRYQPWSRGGDSYWRAAGHRRG